MKANFSMERNLVLANYYFGMEQCTKANLKRITLKAPASINGRMERFIQGCENKIKCMVYFELIIYLYINIYF